MRPGLLLLGEIVGPWGRKGEAKLFPYADLRPILAGRDGLFLEREGKVQFRALEGFRFHKSLVILKFKECSDISEVETLRGLKVGIPRATAPSLPPDTYYHYDIIGLKVISGQEPRGRVTEIWTTPANDIYVVEEGGKSWLLPATKEVIQQVDLERGTLQVNPPKGLIDLEEV